MIRAVRKRDTFRRQPWVSLRCKRVELVHATVTRWGRDCLARAGVLPALEAFRAARPAWATPPEYADLWYLYRMVRRRRPSVIWEFGSGNSTVALASALADNGAGHLFSMDTDATWAAVTIKAMPECLRRLCTVRHAPLERLVYRGATAWRHRGVPERTPNFAYLDSGRTPTIDLLLVEEHLPSDFYLVIDDRQATTRFLHEHFVRRYRYTARRLVRQQVFELEKSDAVNGSPPAAALRRSA